MSAPFIISFVLVLSLWIQGESFVLHSFKAINNPFPEELLGSFVARTQSGIAGAHFQLPYTTRSASTNDQSEGVTNNKTMAPFNFGPVSRRDDIVYTAERPGNPPGKNDPIDNSAVHEWLAYCQDMKDIRRVLSLLDENELTNYQDEPGLLKLYQNAGLKCLNQGMRDAGAVDNILAFLSESAACQEKVVVHCTGGVGRAGRVAAAWLVHQYGLSPEEATRETLEIAKLDGVDRKGDVAMLEEWLATKTG